MRRTTDHGFTLVELMIVVVVVGVLAAVATVSYMRYVRKARASEVGQLFAEFKTKEEAFNAEFGRYLSTSADESDLFPTTLAGDRLQDISAVAKPATWTQLKIQPGRSGLYCQYGTIAGASGNAAGMGVVGLDIFGGAAPTSTWFYVLARCNFDNDPTVDSLYAARGDLTETYKENEGR